jgi:hypothetical protein
MKLELYQRVALRRDLSEYRLKEGDVAMLVDYVPHDGEDGYVLEVFNALGESIAVVAVPISAVAPLQANEVFSVRILDIGDQSAA